MRNGENRSHEETGRSLKKLGRPFYESAQAGRAGSPENF